MSYSHPSFQAKSEAINMPQSSSNNKSNSWARTLFAGNSSGYNNQSSEFDSNDNPVPESPGTSYNQQATNAVLSLLNIHVCCAVIYACFYFLMIRRIWGSSFSSSSPNLDHPHSNNHQHGMQQVLSRTRLCKIFNGNNNNLK